MNPATAIVILVTALSVGLLRTRSRLGAAVSGLCGAAVAAFGLLKLISYATGFDFGLDRILFRKVVDVVVASFPNRVAPSTAVALLLLGSALVFLRFPRGTGVGHLLTLAAALVVLQTLVDYLFNFESPGLGGAIPMALNTAVALLLLVAGVLFSTSGSGWIAVVADKGPAGAAARRLLPAVIMVPIVLGWLALRGQRIGLYDADDRMSLTVVATIACFGALVWWTAKRIESEVHLREERHFLTALLDTLTEGIVACDADGKLTLFNSAMREAYGLEPATVAPERWAEHYGIFSPDGKAKLEPNQVPLYRALQGESLRDVEIALGPTGGPFRNFLVSGQPIIDDKHRKLGAVVALHDVSKNKSLEFQLAQSQKMEAIGTLAGGIAHDFNNLLTAILGYSDLLKGQIGNDSLLLENVEEIRKAGERAASLTRQLLAFSRRQVIEPKVVDLNAIVADMDRMLRRLIGEDVNLSSVMQPDLGRAKVDPGQIEQVVMNLAVNARDAMPGGGRLTIETGNQDFDEEYARAHIPARPGRYVMLAVSDTGAGMDEQTRARIFEPFFTTKESGKGTGLGLSTVYGIVKQSGGFIWVYSEPGQGTTFKIYFPRVDEPVAKRVSAATPEEPKDSRGAETLLLVEDEKAVRKIARIVLERAGYRVLEAVDGSEAVNVARNFEGEIHLLLSDSVMPGLPVRELIASFSALRPKASLLLMSGYTSEAVTRTGLFESGIPFLQKPFSAQTLTEKVKNVLNARIS